MLIFFSLLWLSFQSAAQLPEFRQYTMKDGLPSSTAYSITQDHKGYMWFGTENGLCRFDGKTFKTLTMNDGLTDNIILGLYEDKYDRLWIISFSGRICYCKNGVIHNPENDSLTASIPYLNNCPLPVEDQNKILYFFSENKLITINKNKVSVTEKKLDLSTNNDSFNIFPVSPDLNLIVVNKYFIILKEKNEPFWFYTNNGIINNNKVIKPISKFNNLPPINTVHFQKQIKDDLWLFSKDDGIIQLSNLSGKNISIHQYLHGFVINNNFVDNENNIWFSTTGHGLFFLPGNTRSSVIFEKTSGLPSLNFSVLHKDSNNNIWAGTAHNLLYCIKNNSFLKYTTNTTCACLDRFYDITDNGKGDIYCAKDADLVLIKKNAFKTKGIILRSLNENGTTFNPSNYKSLSISKNGTLLATTSSMLYLYNPLTKGAEKYVMQHLNLPFNKKILTACMAETGKIWVANNNGLNMYNGKDWTFFYKTSPYLRYPITRIAELNDHTLLVATKGKGIFLFDGIKVKQIFDESQGLASNICSRVFVDGIKVYVATALGVTKLIYTGEKLLFVDNYNTDDGLSTNEVNDVISLHDTLYIATANGISIVPEVTNGNSNPPQLYFNSVQFGKLNITDQVKPILSYLQDYIKFNFIGITYQQSNRVSYKYRLLGANPNWESNVTGAVNFSNLLPGDYVFEVMAKKQSSVWSAPISFPFTIKGPLWMKLWFKILIFSILFAGIGVGSFGLFWRVKHQKIKEEAISARMIQLEQQALNALMNPHFIFNSLNSIQQYLQKNDTMAANRYLSEFAKLTRKNMESVSKNTVSLEDELERLELYLNFEKLRFGSKLNFHFTIAEELDLDEIEIPPMVLQPFVENAIWHGIMPLPEGGSIYISVNKIDDDRVKIEIRDTGVGIDSSREFKKNLGLTHKSKGMQLSIDRLQLWNRNSKLKYELKAEQGQSLDGDYAGTVVTMVIPL
jgi:ligand-binding sensor domain-containing protein